jgi:cephalosporin hydroxylase
MKSLKEIYQNYKQSGNVGHGDKGTIHSYIEKYEMLFSKFRNKPINILEIGIAYGESLSMWQEYFSSDSCIYGIDNQDREFQKNRLTDNMIVMFGDATKPDILKYLSMLENPTFDIIIDDASHWYQDQTATFNIFKSKMNPGGIYVIEDVGHISEEGVREHFESLDNFDEIFIGDNIQTKADDVLAVYRF